MPVQSVDVLPFLPVCPECQPFWALLPAERCSGEEIFDMVVPAMKVHEFNFTEVTRF